MRPDDFEIFDTGKYGWCGVSGIELSDINEFCFRCSARGICQGRCVARIVLSSCY